MIFKFQEFFKLKNNLKKNLKRKKENRDKNEKLLVKQILKKSEKLLDSSDEDEIDDEEIFADSDDRPTIGEGTRKIEEDVKDAETSKDLIRKSMSL